MRTAPGNPGGASSGIQLGDAALLLAGGVAGALILTFLQVPAGALIGAVIGSVSANRLGDLPAARTRRRREAAAASGLGSIAPGRVRTLPGLVRIAGQVLLGVMAGTRLNGETLRVLANAAVPIATAVVVMLAVSVLLARFLIQFHRIDPVTAAMAAAPGGISELAGSAQRRGADMHVVLTIHLFRVLVVVLGVLPLMLFMLEQR